MKLEAGKYYKRADGEKVGPAKYHAGGWSASGWHYYPDGRHLYGHACNNLVSEWKEETAMDIKVGDVVEHREFDDTAWSVAIWEVLAISGQSAWIKFGQSNPRTVNLVSLRKPVPKPVVTEAVMFGHVLGKAFNSGCNKHPSDTHKITISLTDGVPDCQSIKMEKL